MLDGKKCTKISFLSLNILYYFFNDLQNKNGNIQKLLLSNQENLSEYFKLHEKEMKLESMVMLLTIDIELIEIRNFIYYEYQKLENNN